MLERAPDRVDIFPVVKSEAVCVQIDADKQELKITSLGLPKTGARNSKSPTESPVTLLKGKGNIINVLLDGYCFYSPLNAPDTMMLTNLLLCEGSQQTPGIMVDKSIHPGMIALLGKNKKTTTVCGVTHDGKKMLAYSMVEFEESGEMKSVAPSAPVDGGIGSCVYSLLDDENDKRTITAMVSCAHHIDPTHRHVIIGYNNGQIELYRYEGGAKLNHEMTLKSANDDFKSMQLHVDNKGHLVAFSPAAEKIEVWNLSQAGVSQTHKVSKLSDLSISPDGAYIVARDNHLGREQSLYVYEFPALESTKLTSHRWITKHNIEAVAIDVNGTLLTAYNDENDNLNVMNEGTVRQLMISKRSSYTLHPDEDKNKKFELSNVPSRFGATLTRLGQKKEGRRCLIKKHSFVSNNELEEMSVVKMPKKEEEEPAKSAVVSPAPVEPKKETAEQPKKKFLMFGKREDKKTEAVPPASKSMKK